MSKNKFIFLAISLFLTACTFKNSNQSNSTNGFNPWEVRALQIWEEMENKTQADFEWLVSEVKKHPVDFAAVKDRINQDQALFATALDKVKSIEIPEENGELKEVLVSTIGKLVINPPVQEQIALLDQAKDLLRVYGAVLQKGILPEPMKANTGTAYKVLLTYMYVIGKEKQNVGEVSELKENVTFLYPALSAELKKVPELSKTLLWDENLSGLWFPNNGYVWGGWVRSPNNGEGNLETGINRGLDCSTYVSLVYKIVRSDTFILDVLYKKMTHQELNEKQQKTWTDRLEPANALSWFDLVDPKNAEPGDIVVWRGFQGGGHVSIFLSWYENHMGDVGLFIELNRFNPSMDGPNIRPISMKLSDKYTFVFRPKKDRVIS